MKKLLSVAIPAMMSLVLLNLPMEAKVINSDCQTSSKNFNFLPTVCGIGTSPSKP